MPQITTGIRSILSIPKMYQLFKKIIGVDYAYSNFVNQYIRPNNGDKILDIGCGPGDMLSYLPKVEYIGFDLSEDYIKSARENFGDRGTFICEKVSTSTLEQTSYFDLVMAIGILHHLDDAEALQLFQLAQLALKPGGRLITFDGVYIDNQSPCARYFLSKDRGQNIRTKDGYETIASQVFANINVNIRHNLLRIPYTHIIMELTK